MQRQRTVGWPPQRNLTDSTSQRRRTTDGRHPRAARVAGDGEVPATTGRPRDERVRRGDEGNWTPLHCYPAVMVQSTIVVLNRQSSSSSNICVFSVLVLGSASGLPIVMEVCGNVKSNFIFLLKRSDGFITRINLGNPFHCTSAT